MSDTAHKLLEQVVADPRDQAARAVYADALIQQGDARGTFIALQRLLDGPLSPDKRESAKREAAALLDAHKAEWMAPAKFCEVRLKGGFVHAIRAEAGSFLKNGAALVAAEPVLEVTLTGASDADLQKLAASDSIARVSSLSLSGSFGDKGAAVLMGSPHISRLRSLNLGGGKVGKAFAAAVGNAKELARLCLTGCGMGDEPTKTLAAAPLDKLERLYLSRNELTDASMPALADGRALSHVLLLALNGNEIGDEGVAALAKGKALAHLVRLELRETQCGDEGAQAIGKSKTLKALEKLNLLQTEVDSDAIKSIRRKGIEVEGGNSW